MKTIEDLQLMTVPVLTGIHTELTGAAPTKGMTKDQLVQRVYDLQQPDPVDPAAQDDSDDDATGDDANDLDVNDELDDLVGDDAPAAEPVQRAPMKVEHSDKDADVSKIAEALAHLPITVEFEDGCITLRKGAKGISTTVKQPLYRIVNTATIFARAK